MEDINKIKKYLQENLSEYRYKHSINVMEEAKKLAKHYHVDINKSMLCGLCHDISKEYSNDENKRILLKYNLSEKLLTKENEKIIHGLIGAIVCKEKFKFSNDMLKAIKYHNTGYIGMNKLDKIIFVADKIEQNKNYEGIEEERKIAYQDLDQAVILCLKNQIKHLETKNKKIHPQSQETLKYLEEMIVARKSLS